MEKVISLETDQVKIVKVGDNKVLFEVITYSDRTKAGIILPETAKEDKPVLGKVLMTGKEVENVSNGDIILLSHYSGVEFSLRLKGDEDKRNLKIVSDIDIWAVIEKVEK